MKTLSIVGRLGQDSELKYLNDGSCILNASVAVENRVKRGSEWVNETLWVRVALFGKRGEGLAKHLKKGTRCAASGELNIREYESHGAQRYSVELKANDIEVLFDRKQDSGATQQRDTGSQQDYDPADDQIPF